MEKEQLIQKWLNNELTPEEHKAFEALDDHKFYVDIVENAKHFKVPEDQKVDGFETFKQKNFPRKTKTVRPLWANPLLRIASVLIIALGLYVVLFHNPKTHIQTLAHQKTTVALPDASQVTLNAVSEIAFHKKDWDKKREVRLEGEAFFKVQKGSTFEVMTSDGVVTVVGTEFSVKQRPGYFEVKCYQGIVAVRSQNISETLTAGKTFRMLDGKLSQNRTTDHAPQWLENVSDFEAVPFVEVVNELQRQYNIVIQMENIGEAHLFSGGFVHTNLNNALISITQPLNLEYKIISPERAVIYGRKK